MKVLSLLTGLLFAAASSAASAVTVAGYDLASTADNASVNYGDFYDWSSGDSKIAWMDSGLTPAEQQPNSAQLNADITYTDPSSLGAYVYSRTNGARLTVNFGSPIYNGVGSDLALFFVGDLVPSVQVSIGNSLQTIDLQTPATPTCVSYTTGGCTIDPSTGEAINGYNVTVGLIDLSNFNVPSYTGISSFTLTTDIWMVTQNPDGTTTTCLSSSTGCTGSLRTAAELSLAGSMYTTPQGSPPSPVPLPLPALLFGSGLGVLGLFGRKRNKQS